jgi:excisionase family DNA binding protein
LITCPTSEVAVAYVKTVGPNMVSRLDRSCGRSSEFSFATQEEKAMPVNLQNLMTVEEAAKKARVHRQTVYWSIWNNKLKAILVGRQYFINEKDFKEWRANA